MAIQYDQADGLISIHTRNTTYQMQADAHRYLLHLYYGPHIDGSAAGLQNYMDRGFSANPEDAGADRAYSLDQLTQEFPFCGSADTRAEAFRMRNPDGSCGCDLRFRSLMVSPGKYGLTDLPASYDDIGQDAETLDITLEDAHSGVEVHLLYGVFEAQDIITRAVRVDNRGEQAISIEKAASCTLDFTCGDYETLTFYGRHAMERSVQRTAIGHGRHCAASLRGASSHFYNPFVILMECGTNEDAGNAFGIHLVYSGNFLAEAEKNGYDQTRFVMGLHEEGFRWQLLPGESFTAPECIMAFSDRGLALLSNRLHRFIRDHVIRDRISLAEGGMGAACQDQDTDVPGRMEDGPERTENDPKITENGPEIIGNGPERTGNSPEVRADARQITGVPGRMAKPVLVNNWEATYFDFDGEKILSIARTASELGIEMLVLDDGWFGKRGNDTAGLGDWTVNESKLGMTLSELSERIHAYGLQFGLWFEPEMVSEDSDLYRAHPDWAQRVPGRSFSRCRGQLVLDYARNEVVDAVYEQMISVLDNAQVDYIKWDFNRNLTDVFSPSLPPGRQGETAHRYMLGVYRLLERLRSRYPQMLIEGCSGGGGRFDCGMLYYTPQIWCSDNTDAADRCLIQYGTSFGYPPVSMGAHVSAVPNHQTGRTTPFDTRAAVAMAGTFGYELDLTKLSSGEAQKVREQIRQFRDEYEVTHYGDYYRLSDPCGGAGLGGSGMSYGAGPGCGSAAFGTAGNGAGELAAWMCVAQDRSRAVVTAVQLNVHGNPIAHYLRLKGLDASAYYVCEETGQEYAGNLLMHAGLKLPTQGIYDSMRLHLTRK